MSFIKELLSAFDYVELVDERHNLSEAVNGNTDLANGLAESLEWINEHKKGNVTQAKTFEQLLNEL